MPDSAQPLPTPFDITAIPHFPFEPELSHWLILILLAVLILLIRIGMKSATKLKHISLSEDPSETVLAELDRLVSAPADKHIASYASLVVKRWLSHLDAAHDYTSKSPFQIRQIDTSRRPRGWRELITCLLEIDSIRFAGRSDIDFEGPIRRLRDLTVQLSTEINMEGDS